MSTALASLRVVLGLDASDFVQSLDRSDREAKRFAQRMEANGRVIGQALGLGVTAAAGALFLMTKNAIDAADKLNDLSKSTGVSVELLGGLGFAAKQSGTDLDGVAKAFGKLRLQIAAAVGGNAESIQLFDKLKISVKELNTLPSSDIFLKMADQFATYDDHANTAALANKAFGKTYASMLPLLSEGGEKIRQNIAYFEKYGGITTETARQSDEFNDTLAKLGLLSGQFGRQLAVELLPSLNSLAEAFVKGTEKGGAFKESASDIAAVIKGTAIAAVAASTEISALGHALGAIAAQVVALASGQFSLIGRIEAEAEADQNARFARMSRLIDAINNPTAAGTVTAGVGGGKGRRAPSLPDSGAASSANAEARALLDAQLKEIDRGVKLEQDLLRDREHFLQQYYADDLISIAKFYSQRQAFLDDAIQKEVSANEEKIALLRAFKPKDEADRIKNERDIADVIADTTKKQREYFRESIDGRLAEARGVKEFQRSVEEADAALMAMRGDTVGAAAKAFDIANERLRAQLRDKGMSLAGNDEARKRIIDQTALSKETLKYSNIVEGLSIAQARVDLLAQTGAIGELEALGKKDALAKRFVESLTAQVNAYEKIALAMNLGPAKDAALLDIERMRLGIDQLAASGDGLAKKFNDVFADAFGDNVLAALNKTKSLKDAFNDMGKDIVRSLNQIAVNEIKTYLFGGKGALSGIGGFLSSLFGGNASAPGGFGMNDRGAGSSGGINTNGLIGSLFSGGGLASLFGGVPGESLSDSFAGFLLERGLGGGYAAGTNFAPGGWSLVGERGPEVINLPRGAQVIPNHELARRESREPRYNMPEITVNVLPGASRKTADQAAMEIAREVTRAMARNG